ncbi:creatininase family protein [Tanticharoenia sakaeratensis]|uniref:Creatinine amidohydrolase family protein n=1 Tax=Tanticharoenia sakaeratensis NBRC 103193 TaxID=1231623 RepID=A0A0D6MM30_9PROT|nr:creatininase family protein [Tanticharoenia sakaeratensis]GAN54328.1 creatinine amidohydrolase family protein [Tanticharoenia sakaeratensis NBRC 103193]GBQ18935.1 creatininase [Tanticharoenia sakaeratensis NBRC 103193]
MSDVRKEVFWPKKRWCDMISRQFRALPSETVAILPVAAIEQHGPHLPVYVDACLNEHLLDRALDLLPDSVPATALPIQSVGKSEEHIAYPGTLTLSAETLTRVLIEIGECVARAGVRRLVLLNSHGGQPQILDIVARTLRRTHDMFVVCVGWSRFGVPDGLFTDAERRFGIHGGDIETSLMLHFRPDLVEMERAGNFAPWPAELAQSARWLEAEGRVGFGWLAQDLHASGAAGDASIATAEKGRAVADQWVAGFLELLEEIAAYPLDRIVPAHGALGL